MPAPKGNTYAKDAAKRKREAQAKAEAEANKKEKKMGRPKFEIDYAAVKNLAALMCTQEEIAAFLGCDVTTLQRDKDFHGVYKLGS